MTCVIRPEETYFPSPGMQPSFPKFSDQVSVGNNSHFENGPIYYMHSGLSTLPPPAQSSGFEQFHGRANNPFGDILPPLLAHAYGFYGEPWERIKAGMKLLTICRIVIFLVSPVVYSPLFASDVYDKRLRLSSVFPSTTYLVAISLLISAHSLFLLLYGLAWLYYSAQCSIPAKIFLASVPNVIVKQYGLYILLSYYGDGIFIFFTLSSFSAIVPMLKIITADEDQSVKMLFILGACFAFLELILFLLTMVVSKRIKESYSMLSGQLPVAMRQENNNQQGLSLGFNDANGGHRTNHTGAHNTTSNTMKIYHSNAEHATNSKPGDNLANVRFSEQYGPEEESVSSHAFESKDIHLDDETALQAS